MFEHLKMKKQLKQQLSKVLSIALSVAMLVGTIPADMLGGIASVKAATGDGDVSATTFDDSFPSGVFTASGVGTVTNDSNSATAEGETLYFTMPAESTISFSVIANNTGALTVKDADNNANLKLEKIVDTETTEIAAGDWGTLATGDYVLTATALTKLYSIKLEHTSTGNNTVTATVTTTFASGLTSSNYDVKLKEETEGTADEQPITDSSASVSLKKNTTYVAVCTKKDENDTDVPEATVTVKVDGSEVNNGQISVGDAALTIELEIAPKAPVTNKIAAKITLDATTNAVIAAGTTYTISLENADTTSNETIEYSDTTQSYELTPGATYNVKSSDNSIRATVDGKTTVTAPQTAGSTPMAININLSTQVEAGVAFTGDTLPTDATVKLANKDYTENDITISGLATGAKVNLWIGDEYELKCSSDKVTVTIDSKPSIKVAKDTANISVAVKAESTSSGSSKHVFDATQLTMSEEADNEEIEAGTTLFDDYFKIQTYTITDSTDENGASYEGKVVKRWKSKTDKSVGCVQVDKQLSSAIEFTVNGTADVDIAAASTGGSNRSRVALINEAGNVIENTANQLEITGTTYVTFKYLNLPAGTYRVVSPVNPEPDTSAADGSTNTNRRGARIQKIEVNEIAAETTTTEHLFDSTQLTMSEEADNEEIEAGTTLFDDYFKIQTYTITDSTDENSASYEGKVVKRWKSKTDKSVGCVQVDKQLSSAIEFTVTGTADVDIEAASTGGSNRSRVALINEAGEVIENTSSQLEITGTTYVTFKYLGIPAGTYRVVSPVNPEPDTSAADGSTNTNRRGARIKTIKVTETTGGARPPRADWDEIDDPEITGVALDASNPNKINVTVSAPVGYDGGDSLVVVMYDAEGEEVTRNSTANYADTHIITFTPAGSGTYTFEPTLKRSKETDKTGAPSQPFKFTLPLVKPTIASVTNKGLVKDDEGNDIPTVELVWNSITEADAYVVKATNKETKTEVFSKNDVTDTSYVFSSGLEVGGVYIFSVAAKRIGTGADGEDEITEFATSDVLEVTGTSETTWAFSAYGDSTSLSKNGYSVKGKLGKYNNADVPVNHSNDLIPGDDDVRVWSLGGAGKIVPNSVDGLAFYYTTVDPKVNNFKFTAIAHVNEWTISNAQDGFGIMAADQVGANGDSGKIWNNSYQALASKVEFRWDADNKKPVYDSDETKPRYSMKLGIGSSEKKGVTKENIGELTASETSVEATAKYFRNGTKTLEASLAGMVGGTYNIIGNYVGGVPEGTVADKLVTDLKFTIELNNTGYFLSYTPVKVQQKEDGTYEYVEIGEPTTNKYYDRDALSHIKDEVYVGVFASRNADITFKNIDISLSNPATDPPAEVQPIEYVTPSYGITSGETANTAEYKLQFAANWPGKVTIKDSKGSYIVNGANPENENEGKLAADEYGAVVPYETDPVTLSLGTNTYTWTFTPDRTYNPEPNPDYPDDPTKGFEQLEDYRTQTGTFTVTYKSYGQTGQSLYVSPKGSALGNGTKASPLDIYTAVKYVQAGQTIYLMEGTYNLSKTVKIDRGIDGKPAAEGGSPQYIFLIPAPDCTERPVLDFGRHCEGIVLAGNYWYLKGFDVTRSMNSKDGIRVCGSYNVVEQVNTYNNGNTGLQISRYVGTDTKASGYWPHDNLILNCTSYLNADQGFEDADGFAAKLTIGENNVFDGCVAAYNADDGWDLFAKVETGNIGAVTIKNSIAYKNGYVLIDPAADKDNDGKISKDESMAIDRILTLSGTPVPAGNGNGFKMGGSNLAGNHHLINSIAFYNAAKGIDSNSCPDIKVTDSISFNNEGANVAFYGTATNTDFAATGLISYRTDFFTYEDSSHSVKENRENIKPLGNQSMDAIVNDTNYLWMYPEAEGQARKSTNKSGQEMSNEWFKNIDFAAFDAAVKADTNYLRNPDGSLNMHDFLTLDPAHATSGGSVGGATPSVPPVEVPNDVPVTGGDISSGDATDETESGVRPEDMDEYNRVSADLEAGEVLGLWMNVVEADEIYYTGKAIRPEVHVYEGTTLLTKKDYSITFRNNINAYDSEDDAYKDVPDTKKPSITVRGLGNYVGIADIKYFDIHPVNLANDLYVAAMDVALGSNNREQAFKPVVKFNGRALNKGRDYTCADTRLTTGSTEVELNAVAGGNFTGSVKVNFSIIDKNNLAKTFKVDRIAEQPRLGYNDYEQKDPRRVMPKLVVKNSSGATLKGYYPDCAENNDKDAEGVNVTVGNCDYVVTYCNNVEVGTATAIITGKNTYAGSKEVSFRIVAPRINTLMTPRVDQLHIFAADSNGNIDVSKEFDFTKASYSYSGKAIEINGIGLAAKNADGTWTSLEKNVDYTLTYRNNNRAGNASVIVKGIGNYSGSATKNFKIEALDLSNPGDNVIGGTFAKDYELVTSYEKGGSRPNVELLINGNKMTIGKDYTVTYRNNTMVNGTRKPQIILTGRGALKGRLEKDFTIVKKELDDPNIVITADDAVVSSRVRNGSGYTGTLAPKIVLKDANGRALSAGSDYDKVGITYELISGNGSVTQNGRNWTATINSENDVLEVEATVKAVTSGNRAAQCNYSGETTIRFRVGYAKQSIRSARVVVNYNNGRNQYFDYTTQEIKLYQGETDDLTVTLGNQTLTYGVDFEIVTNPNTYKNNIKKGTASVTIRGIGKYTGVKVVKYRIGAKTFKWWEKKTSN